MMKKNIISAFLTIVAVYGYSQTYLPLAGGTLTGDLYMGNATNKPIYFDGGYSAYIKGGGIGHGTPLDIWTGNGLPNPTLRALNGNVQLFGALTGTSATFSGNGIFGTMGAINNFQVRVLDGQIITKLQSQSSGDVAGVVGTESNHAFKILTNNVEQLRIGTNGYIGIGTTNPPERLSIDGKVNVQYYGTSTYGLLVKNPSDNLKFKLGTTTGGYLNIQGARIDNDAAYDLSLQAEGGNVGIGTTNTQGYKLAVAGNVIAESMKVAIQGNWPDYVFKSGHKLPSLREIEEFVKANQHLPEIPSESEIKKEGVDLGLMDAKLLKKIEELTLYMIDMNKKMEAVQSKNEELEKELAQLKANR